MITRAKKFWTIAATLSFALTLAACGGDDGGGPPPPTQTTKIGGVVIGPSGALAKAPTSGLLRWFASMIGFPDEAMAQAQGLFPVPNARVFLVNVDTNGKPIGAPLAVSTTDVDGFFVLNIPSGTNLSPTASKLTVIQAAVGNAPSPVPVGTTGVLNVPAVQQLMLVDPAGELATRRMIAAGIPKFSTPAAAGYVGVIQALLDQVPSLVGSSIATTITNISNDQTFQTEVLPTLVDIEQSTNTDQSVVNGTYSTFAYRTYPDSDTTPFHRTTEHGDLTFDPVTGTVVVNANEFGGSLQETCTTTCSRTFTLQSFQDQTSGVQGLFFRTATNRVIFSAPGAYSFAAHANPTGTVAIYGAKYSDGQRGLGIVVKRGSGISSADVAGTFNFVDFGSILNQSNVNQAVVSGSTWTGIVHSRSGVGTVTFNGTNSPVQRIGFTGGDSTMGQQVSCTPSGGGCTINATLSTSGGGENVALPFTITPDGGMVLTGKAGSGQMSSDRALYAATQTDPLSPADISFSLVVRQPLGMSPANISGTYRIITLQDDLLTTAQITTRLLTGTAEFDGVNSATFNSLAAQVDRVEGCPAGACEISTTITGAAPPQSETRTYAVTPTGTLTFTGGNIPTGATVSGEVSPDASFFVVQMQVDDIAGTSTRSITLGVKIPE